MCLSLQSGWLRLLMAGAWGASAATAMGQPLRPRPHAVKPQHTLFDPITARTDVIAVKFHDGLQIRLRDRVLTDMGTGALTAAQPVLASVVAGRWERTHRIAENKLATLKQDGEASLHRELADLNVQFNLFLPAGMSPAAAIDAFNALEAVEIALPFPRRVQAPTPPDFQLNQAYLNPATMGVDALNMWPQTGGIGAGVRIADIEFSWNLNHQDLPPVTLLGAPPNDPFNNTNHGTAVLGEMAALHNGFGVTGIAYGSSYYVVAANTGPDEGVTDVAAAITTALDTLTTGDVILIELQLPGPHYVGIGQFGYVAVEWFQPNYDAIVTAVGNGVTVVEAAGNGSEDLDDPIYSTGNGGHWPFLPANDSGAILVGGGAQPGSPSVDRSRLWFSNYGATVDLQGWGEGVYTTGYGNAYSAEGQDLWYTGSFNGTSSASPIVAGAGALLQSAYYAQTGFHLTPTQLKSFLILTGSPQQNGFYPASQHIGPRPNATAALTLAMESDDCNNNGINDGIDILNGTSQDCNATGIPDECEVSMPGNDCNANGIPDSCEFADCNQNCVADDLDISSGTSTDCDGNGVPDSCQVAAGQLGDFNHNGIADICENIQVPGFQATLIAKEGDPAPGTDGVFFSLLTTPAVNNAKQVAFWADTTTNSGIFFWSNGTLSIRAQENTPVPGVPEAFFDHLTGPSLNDSGDLTFGADFTAPPLRGVFLSVGTEITPVALRNDPIPGMSGTLGLPVGGIPTALLNSGDIYFYGSISGEPGSIGASGAIFKHSGGLLSVIAVSGVSYPNLGTFNSILGGPAKAPDGRILFRANIGGLDSVIQFKDGSLTKIVQEGEFAPGVNGCFESFQEVSMPSALETHFLATVACVTTTHGIFKKRLSGAIEPLVLPNTAAPVPGNTFVANTLGLLRSNPFGNLYFVSALSSGNPLSGLFKLDQRTGVFSTVLLNGDPAPLAGGLAIADVGGESLNSIGDMALAYRATDDVRRLIFLDQNLTGDLDHDDDVDLTDYETFLGCMNGPGGGAAPPCDQADFDHDGDIDVDDFAVMQAAFIPCQQNGIDCNGNGVADACELAGSIATDCDGNGTLDECDIFLSGAVDCNGNLLPDSCDIASGASHDFNSNGIPDECEGLPDCNFNGVGDPFDIGSGQSQDCNNDSTPDECELFAGAPYLIGASVNNGHPLARFAPSSPAGAVVLSTGNPEIRGLAETCDGKVWGVGVDGLVYAVNPVTGLVTAIGGGPYVWDGAAFDCAHHILYASTSDAPGPDYGLYRVSTVDGSVEYVGNLFDVMEGLAFDSDHQILYGISGNSIIWSIDSTTAARTAVCPNLGISSPRGLCFADGALYTQGSTSTVYAIDPANCAVTVLGNLPASVGAVSGLACLRESTDCNHNFIPDNCDISSGTSTDLNNNGVPDECDPADCDDDGIPDQDELTRPVSFVSSQLTPFGAGFPQTYTITGPPPALSDVTFTFTVSADLGNANEWFNVSLNGMTIFGSIFANGGLDCPIVPQQTTRTTAPFVFNGVVNGGNAAIGLLPTSTVDPFQCAFGSYIVVRVDYLTTNDCNNNQVPDDCDIAAGTSQDSNSDGIPDECQAP